MEDEAQAKQPFLVFRLVWDHGWQYLRIRTSGREAGGDRGGYIDREDATNRERIRQCRRDWKQTVRGSETVSSPNRQPLCAGTVGRTFHL